MVSSSSGYFLLPLVNLNMYQETKKGGLGSKVFFKSVSGCKVREKMYLICLYLL